MKKLVVTGFTANNVANQDSVSFTTNGGNVIVTGQNGAGKTTIKNSLMWALIGNTSDGEKLIPYNSDKLPIVEVELSDGNIYTQFRKELYQRTSSDGKISRSVNCFICGTPVTLKDFEQSFSRFMPNSVLEILLDLGSFFKLKSDVQRNILTAHFSAIKDTDVIASDKSLLDLDTKGLSIESHGEKMKSMIRRIKADRANIKPQIDLLTSQIVDVADERENCKSEVAALEGELEKLNAEFMKWQEQVKNLQKPRDELSELNREIWQLECSAKNLRDIVKRNERELEKLREKYVNAAEICPTCGQSIKGEHVEKIREKIVAEGKTLKLEIEKRIAELTEIETRLENLRPKAKKLSSAIENQSADFAEINRIEKQRSDIRREISARKSRIEKIAAQFERNDENQSRIEQLRMQEKTFGKNLTECERQLSLVERFVQKKMEMVTDAINSKFQFVKFKMFETQKNGEVKNICEVTLNDVPYSKLSKGEKFKAALDVLQTFQNYYGVMLPLIIDDAESYTSNSLIDIPNQKILFKVVEGRQLQIEVKPAMLERRLSA